MPPRRWPWSASGTSAPANPPSCRAASASASRWRARSSTARGCCCSTSRSARWTSSCVGTSNVVERDGRRFTVRPEKVRLLGDGEPGDGLHVEDGTVREVAYAGMITRYVVELDHGGELQVVRQNLEVSSAQAAELRGRKVRVAWHEEQTSAIEGASTLEEGA